MNRRQPRTDMGSNLEERLQFETLLSDLSAKFVNVPAEQVDAEIENAQRRICEDLDLDLCTLWVGSGGSASLLTLTHFYRRVVGPQPPEQMRQGILQYRHLAAASGLECSVGLPAHGHVQDRSPLESLQWPDRSSERPPIMPESVPI